MTKYAILIPCVQLTDADAIRMTENGVTQTLTLVNPATGSAIASGVTLDTFLRGDGADDDLVQVIEETLDSHTGGTNTYTASLFHYADPAGESATFDIQRTGGSDAFSILWSHAATTFDPSLIGFEEVDDTGATLYQADHSPKATWVSSEVYASLERAQTQDAAASRAKSGKVRGVRRAGPFQDRIWRQELVDGRRIWSDQNTSDPYATLSQFLEEWADGRRFEFHAVTASSYPTLAFPLSASTLVGTFHLDEEALRSFEPERIEPGLSMYDFTMRLMAYVS